MNKELAKRAVACKHWRWMPGMLNGNDGTRHMGGLQWAWEDPYRHHALGLEIDDWPDLSDPAMLGCLLALVREAWAPATWITTTACLTSGGVHGWRVQGLDLPMQPTEAEALVAALEAAP